MPRYWRRHLDEAARVGTSLPGDVMPLMRLRSALMPLRDARRGLHQVCDAVQESGKAWIRAQGIETG